MDRKHRDFDSWFILIYCCVHQVFRNQYNCHSKFIFNGIQLHGMAGCTIWVIFLVSENHLFEKYDLRMVLVQNKSHSLFIFCSNPHTFQQSFSIIPGDLFTCWKFNWKYIFSYFSPNQANSQKYPNLSKDYKLEWFILISEGVKHLRRKSTPAPVYNFPIRILKIPYLFRVVYTWVSIGWSPTIFCFLSREKSLAKNIPIFLFS